MRRNKTILIAVFVSLINLNGVVTAQTDSAASKNADSIKSGYTIDECINKLKMDKTVKTDAGYQYWFIDKNFLDGRTVKLSVVKPNLATHAPHSHPEDEIFFILEGNAEVYLNGTWKSVGPYTSFYCPSNVEHGIRNSGDKELKYLVIKKYDKK